MKPNPLSTLMDGMWSLGRGWVGRLIGAGLWMLAFGCFFLAAAILVRGTHWAHVIYAENPYAHVAGGLIFLGLADFVRRGYRTPWATVKKRAGQLTLLSISFGLSFLAAEISLRRLLTLRQQGNSLEALQHRTRQPIRSTHPLGAIIQPSAWPSVIYELQPGLATNFGGRTLRTNMAGLREDRDYQMERMPRSVRMVGLGDSGMFGWNVDQGREYLAVLEHELNKRGDGIIYEVLNFAVPGYNTQLEAETLRHKALLYAPDIVIVGWCENDGQLPFFLLEKEDFTRTDVSFLHLLLSRRDDFRQIASGSTIKDLRSFQREKVSPDILSGTETEGLRRAFTDLKTMRDEHGFHLLVFGPMGRAVRELIAEVGLPVFNTREKIDRAAYPKEWAVHYMHPTEDGHRVLGEHLAVELTRLGWLEPVR
jgi:lysophospholipase L1-like esterase